MKVLYIFALVLFVALATAAPTSEEESEEEDIFKKAHDACQVDPKTKLDEDAVKGKSKEEIMNNPQVRKHSLCMNVKTGLQQENGEVNKDKLKALLEKRIDDQDKVNKIVEECSVKGTGTPEDLAMEFDECMMKHRHKHHRGHEHHKHGEKKDD